MKNFIYIILLCTGIIGGIVLGHNTAHSSDMKKLRTINQRIVQTGNHLDTLIIVYEHTIRHAYDLGWNMGYTASNDQLWNNVNKISIRDAWIKDSLYFEEFALKELTNYINNTNGK
jgi:hypothetical protein